MTLKPRNRVRALGALSLAAALALAGCASAAPAEDEHEDHNHAAHSGEAVETAGPKPRIVMTYDGGIRIVDAGTLEEVADIPLEGFNRINPAGDGRHVLVSTQGGWQLLDVGTWTEAHGDHGHSFETEPTLTDLTIAAVAPGHVVNHDGTTTLFDDGTGKVLVFDSALWAQAAEDGEATPLREYQADAAHHGVAVPTEAGGLFVTVGDADSRSGAALLDQSDDIVVESTDCPGIHGETSYGDGGVLAGCENGALVLHGDHFHHIPAPDDFGRIGNAFAADDSSIVLGDYKTDAEAGIELHDIALIDVEAEQIQIVDAGSSYTWRGLARGIDGSVLVLGTDGTLRVLDAESGEVTTSVSVLDDWTPAAEWQGAHPSLVEHGGFAYVTDPQSGTVAVVDYAAGTVTSEAEIGVEANEVVLSDAGMR